MQEELGVDSEWNSCLELSVDIFLLFMQYFVSIMFEIPFLTAGRLLVKDNSGETLK
jgi:hypothetical protein